MRACKAFALPWVGREKDEDKGHGGLEPVARASQRRKRDETYQRPSK